MKINKPQNIVDEHDTGGGSWGAAKEERDEMSMCAVILNNLVPFSAAFFISHRQWRCLVIKPLLLR